MTHTIQLSDGTTTVSLQYAAGSQEDYKIRYLRQRRDLGLVPVMHSPDASTDGAEPVRLGRENREWFCEMTVYGTSRDDQHNNLHTLERLLQQAGDARTFSPIGKVYLNLQLNGATNWTRYDAKYGCIVDDSGLYELPSLSDMTALPIIVLIVTEPLGYGEIETLKNWLKTPHFEEGAAGLAHNWTETGAPTTTLDTDVYLCGSQSQKVVTDDAGTDGIIADTIAITGGNDCAARIWIYHASGDKVTIDLVGDDSGSLASTDTDETADATATGAGGNTWSRYDLTATSGGSDTTIQLKIERLTGDAAAVTTYYVDKCYVPASWSPLLSNGGFEAPGGGGANIWASWIEVTDGPGTLANETDIVHSGSDAMKVVGSYGDTYVYQDIAVDEGKAYTLSFWTRGDGTYGGYYEIYDMTNGVTISGNTATGITGTSYTEVTYGFTALNQPAACTSIRVYLKGGENDAVTAYFDTSSVTKDDPLPTAWSSYYITTNHYDSDAAHINYVDLDDIPGDQSPLIEIASGEATQAYDIQLFCGLHDTTPKSPSNFYNDLSGAGAGDRQYATTAGVTTAWTTMNAISLANAIDMRGEYLLLVGINDQDTEPGLIRARVKWGSNVYYTEGITLITYQNWTVEVVGPINLMWPKSMADVAPWFIASVAVQGKHVTNTADIWIDFLALIPAHGGLSLTEFPDSASTAGFVLSTLEPSEGDVFYSVDIGTNVKFMGAPKGKYPQLRPSTFQRLCFMYRAETAGGDWHSTASGAWGQMTIKYRPRTTTLLGTT